MKAMPAGKLHFRQRDSQDMADRRPRGQRIAVACIGMLLLVCAAAWYRSIRLSALNTNNVYNGAKPREGGHVIPTTASSTPATDAPVAIAIANYEATVKVTAADEAAKAKEAAQLAATAASVKAAIVAVNAATMVATAAATAAAAAAAAAPLPQHDPKDPWTTQQLVAAAARRTQPPKGPMSMEEALSQPVIVAVMTGHFFGTYERNVDDCTFGKSKLGCHFSDSTTKDVADALWYHGPNVICQRAISDHAKAHAHQLRVIMSMETPGVHRQVDDLACMDTFEVEMTYRLCSHVPVAYFWYGNQEVLRDLLFKWPIPFEQKIDAVSYVNSNCAAARDTVVKKLIEIGKVPVHAFGACQRNQKISRDFKKGEIIRKYKFCIVMENTEGARDYVSEKLWHGMEAGCMPIYMGAPNVVLDYAPTPESMIVYKGSPDLQTVEQLSALLESLMHDQAEYDRRMSWKVTPVNKLSAGFQKLVALHHERPHTQCQLCQLVVQQRLQPTNLTGTHCLRNKKWMQGNSSWDTSPVYLPGSVNFARAALPASRLRRLTEVESYQSQDQ